MSFVEAISSPSRFTRNICWNFIFCAPIACSTFFELSIAPRITGTLNLFYLSLSFCESFFVGWSPSRSWEVLGWAGHEPGLKGKSFQSDSSLFIIFILNTRGSSYWPAASFCEGIRFSLSNSASDGWASLESRYRSSWPLSCFPFSKMRLWLVFPSFPWLWTFFPKSFCDPQSIMLSN